MLDYIRSNTQSFGVKLAFGVIILVFVFWGVGSFSDQTPANIVAKVNGEAITAQEFMQSLQRAEEQILKSNPSVTREQLKQQHLGRQVLNELIRQSLLVQEAERVGITISPLELHKVVSGIPAFHNDKGEFDPKTYTNVLQAQRINPAQYEHDLSRQLLQEKVMRLVSAPAWEDAQEARRIFDFLQEKRVVDYIFVPASNFTAEVKLDANAESAYYEAHKAEFAIPAMVDVQYVRVSPVALVKPESISEDEAKKWYEANKSHFEEPVRVRAAHILVPLMGDSISEADKKKAQESMAKIQAELKSGKDFAAVADAHNGPNAAGPGGELGWITPGKTVKPFEEAAFALKAGEVSGVVQSPFGLHLIKVYERKEAGVKPFAEALPEVRQTLAQERGVEKMPDVLDALIEDNILGKPLAESAARHGLTAEQTGLMDSLALQSKLAISADGAAALIATAAGAPVDTALEAGDDYIVARISKAEPASTKPLESVKESIRTKLTAEKALELAMAKAAEVRKVLKDGPVSQAQKVSLNVQTLAEPVARGGLVQGFNPVPVLDTAIFDAKVGQWLPVAYSVVHTEKGAGALLCHVDKTLLPDAKVWEAARESMLRADVSMRAEALYQLFMQKLAGKAEVQVLNQRLVDQVDM